jgi:hypothetical protein
MGKQGKKKQRQKRKQQEQRPHTNESSDDPLLSSTTTCTVNPSSAIHQLRHSDPKIRQNALIALQATVLHNSSKRVSVAVLQAVREQVMDANLECASAAAECLAQYLSWTPNIEHQAVTTASWTPVLIVRLDQCLKAIQSKDDANKMKLWYALAAPCTKALCKLVELNERALEQVMNSTTDADYFLSTILGLLHVVTTFVKSTDTRWNEWVEDTAAYAARTLHSSLDENPDLVEQINATQNATSDAAWSQLLSTLPDLARLHLCGSLITMYQMVPAPWQRSLLVQHVLPCLTSSLVVQPERLQSLEQEFADAVALRKTQKEDEELEGEIVRKMQERKEPAQIIARRQKEVDRGSKAVFSEEDTKDGEQAMDDALVAWSGIIMPLQVTLEVTANFLSCFIQDEDAMDDDGAKDKEMHQALISASLAEALVKTLQALCSYQDSRGEVPKERECLSDDLTESISKCAACITNCVLSQVLEQKNFDASWQVLRPHASSQGVSSILVVLTQQGLPFPAQDTALIQQLLHSSHEESQRDGVSLLAVMLNDPQHSVHIVTEATAELLRVLKQGESLAKIEALNAIMDLWGQDEFHPQVFASQQILSNFQATLASLSIDKTLDPVAEDVLFNAGRFVDYKLGR